MEADENEENDNEIAGATPSPISAASEKKEMKINQFRLKGSGGLNSEQVSMIPVAAGYGIARFSTDNPLMPIKLNKKRINEILEQQVNLEDAS